MFDWQILPSEEFNLPVISVGNLRVGGTGKTPHIEHLIRFLQTNYKIAVLSRGYKRKSKGFVLAEMNTKVDEIGDEAFQLKRKFPGILVAVDEKRKRGINRLLRMEAGPDVVLLDDAFQHRYVIPGLSILLEDFSQPAIKDFLLPAGRLREPFSSKKRADIILVTKTPGSTKAIDMRIRAREAGMHELQHLYFTKIRAGDPLPVFEGDFSQHRKPGNRILLVSGIANPRTLKPFARKISTRIEEITFRDHHDYSIEDIRNICDKFNAIDSESKIIITTEKDAVKLMKFKDVFGEIESFVFYIPIQVEFLNNDAKNFNSQILTYVSSNKRNSILHKK